MAKLLLGPDGQPLAMPAGPGLSAPRPMARYLRDTGSGVIASRRASLTSHRDDIRQSWRRSAALAMDLVQNSGRLKGAADQVIGDTVGVGLTLTPQPDLAGLGYDEASAAEWSRLVKRR